MNLNAVNASRFNGFLPILKTWLFKLEVSLPVKWSVIKLNSNGSENIEVYTALDFSQKKLLPLIGSCFHDRTAHSEIYLISRLAERS